MENSNKQKIIGLIVVIVLGILLVFLSSNYEDYFVNTNTSKLPPITVREDYVERDIENVMLRKIKNVLLELGKGFTFYGNQVKVSTEKHDYYNEIKEYSKYKDGKLTDEDFIKWLKINDYQIKE